MTPAEILIEVRRIISDTAAPNRYSDAFLLGFVNQTIRRMVMLRPDLFTTVTTIATVANVSEQTLPATAVRLVDIFRVQNGTSIEEADRNAFNRIYPQWATDPAGTPTKYIRHPRNPRAYFLYPRPVAGIVLVGEFVVTPPVYTLNDPITVLPDAYFPAVIDGTVFLAESTENEHVNTTRVKLFYDLFIQGLSTDLQTRNIMDLENGGVGNSQRSPE